MASKNTSQKLTSQEKKINERPRFDTNKHLKESLSQNFQVNTAVLDAPAFDYKFDKLEKNTSNPRFLNKSKFNWQIDDFEIK